MKYKIHRFNYEQDRLPGQAFFFSPQGTRYFVFWASIRDKLFIEEGRINSVHKGGIVYILFRYAHLSGRRLCQRASQEQFITPETDVIQPAFYLSPHITFDWLESRMRVFHAEMPNWVYGGPSTELRKVMPG